MKNEILTGNIRKLCVIKGIGISQIEKEAGLTQGLISKWATTEPTLSRVISISEVLAISLDNLIKLDLTKIDSYLLAEMVKNGVLSYNKVNIDSVVKELNANRKRMQIKTAQELIDKLKKELEEDSL